MKSTEQFLKKLVESIIQVINKEDPFFTLLKISGPGSWVGLVLLYAIFQNLCKKYNGLSVVSRAA